MLLFDILLELLLMLKKVRGHNLRWTRIGYQL